MNNREREFQSNWISGVSGNGVSSIYTLETMVDRIIDYMNPENKDNEGINSFHIAIGTDSQIHGWNRYKFSTSISIRRMIDDAHGRGGIYFNRNEYVEIVGPPKSPNTLRQKIIQEAIYTTTVAQMVSELILNKAIEVDENLLDKINVHLHFDLSEDGDSSVALGTVRGLASGSGFDYSIKPLSWAASGIANRHSK